MSISRGSNFPSAMWMVAAIAGGFSPDDDVESVPQEVAARAITANNMTAKNRRTRERFIDAPT
jgi:rRNA processing protein Krr1/Pno1